MAEPLNQDEINSLLSSAADDTEKSNSNKKERLYREFTENNNSFNAKMVMELIKTEMQKRQDKGHEINIKYMKKEISQSYAKEKVKEYGSGIWWGGESEWYIVGVDTFTVKKTKKKSFHISAVCTMEYISSHFVYGEREPMQQQATITLTLDANLFTEDFAFSWG